MPTEKELRDNPFEQHNVNDRAVWYDPDNDAFYAGSQDPDGCDDATEYATYAELVAA